MKRILFWVPKGTEGVYNGGGKAALTLAIELKDNSYHCIVAHGSHKMNATNICSVNKCCYISNYGSSLYKRSMFLLLSLVWIIRNIGKFDVFYGVGAFESVMIPGFIAKLFRKKVIIKITNQKSNLHLLHSSGRGLRRFIYSIISQKIDYFVAISSVIRKELNDLGFSRVLLIPNGVDIRRFNDIYASRREANVLVNRKRPLLGGKDCSLTILFCGELVERKRPDIVILTVARLPNVNAVFVGPIHDVNYHKYLLSLVQKNMLSDRVSFLGMVDDVGVYMEVADIFMLPSDNEGMSNCMLESMASGLIPVVSDISGVSDVIRHKKSGFICASNTVDEYVRYIQYLEGDLSRVHDISVMARKAVVSRYDISVIADDYSKYFGE